MDDLSSYLDQNAPGILLFGKARMAMLDIASGFWGLRRQVESILGSRLADSIFQQAGVNGGASFASHFMPGTPETPEKALRDCIAAYQAAGFGKYSLEELIQDDSRRDDPSRLKIVIRGEDTFESWAVRQQGTTTDHPTCSYSSGVLVGFVNVLLGRKDVVCAEEMCQAQGDPCCSFTLVPADTVQDQTVVAMSPDPGLERQINLLDLLFERMPMAIAILDEAFSIRRYNRTFEDYSRRYQPESGEPLHPGVNYFDHIPGTERLVKPMFEAVLGGETVREQSVLLETGSRSTYWDLVLAPILDGEQVSGILMVSIDATDREQAVRQLQETLVQLKTREERLSLVMEGINDGVWDWKIPQNRVYFSPRWKEMLGYQVQDLENSFQTWEKLIHPDDQEKTRTAIEEYLSGERDRYYLEHRLKHKDGTYRWILARGKVIRDQQGQPKRMVGSHTDITEQKLAEKALKESEASIRTLIENARNFAVYQVKVDPSQPLKGKVVFVSPSLREIFGVEDIENLGSWFRHLHPEDEERVLAAHYRALQEKKSYREITRWFNPRKQRWIYVQTASSPVFNQDGELTHFNGLIIDISEQKQAELELERRARFEALITEISTRFINLDPREIDQGITQALGEVSRFMDVDRGYVFRYSSDRKTMSNTHEWCREGIEPQLQRMQDLSLEVLSWSNQILLNGEVLAIPDVDALPTEAAAEKGEFRGQKIQSLVCAPMIYRGETIGFVGFDAVRERRDWDAESFQQLEMLASIITNALEHKRFQAIQSGQRQFLELLAAGEGFQETLDSLLQLIEDQWPGMHGLVLLLDEESRRLRVGASVSLPAPYLDSLEGLEIGPQMGSCGTACYTGERVIVEDIETDSRWEGLRDLALQFGLKACWSEPIFAQDGAVMGSFAMYYRHPRTPSPEELRTIQIGAHLAGVAIEQRRAKQALQESQRTLLTLMSNLPGMAYRCKNDRRWTMEFVSQGSTALTGHSPQDLIDSSRVSYGELIHPEDREEVWKTIQQAVNEGEAFRISYRIRVDGKQKWVWEQGRGVYDAAGKLQAVEGFILDITERVEARELLEQRVEERTNELATLLDISHNLTSTLELSTLLDQILDQLSGVLTYNAASIMVLEEDILQIIAYRGPISLDEAQQLRFPLSEAGANRAVIERREPVIIEDIYADTPLAEAIRATAGKDLESVFAYLRCWMGIPLIVKDQLIGMLTLDQDQPGYYTPEHAELAMAFANQVAVAIENARLYQETERRARESEALFSVQQAITSRLEMDEVLQMIADEARRLTRTDISAVYLLEGEELVISYVSGDVPDSIRGYRLSLEDSIAGQVVLDRQAILVQDTWEDDRVDRSASDQVQARSLLIAPLVSGEDTIGTITVANRTPGGFNSEDERLLTTLAANVVISLENARLYEAEQERRQVAEGLRDILAVLNSDRPLEDILRQVIRQAVQLSGADAGAMYALVEESSLVGVISEYQMPEAFSSLSTFPLSNVPAHGNILQGDHFIMEEIEPLNEEERSELSNFSRLISQHFQASLTIPVVVKEAIFGAITLYYQRPRRFSKEEIRLAYSFADQAALAIENADLRIQAEQSAVAEERNRLARDLHDAVTQTLFSASLIAEVLPRIWEKDPAAGRSRLEELRQLTRGALAEMRTLLMELRPKSVLETAFDELLEQLTSAFNGRTRIPIEYNLDSQGEVPDPVKVALYRILQEALNNIAKHARAEQVSIDIRLRQDCARVKIIDNGKGFDPDAIPADSLGLGIMKERAAEINAEFAITSELDKGTEIAVVWTADEEKNHE